MQWLNKDNSNTPFTEDNSINTRALPDEAPLKTETIDSLLLVFILTIEVCIIDFNTGLDFLIGNENII